MEPKYNHIGKTYNSTRKADPYLTSLLVKHLEPDLSHLYLDIGCGTGNYTNALNESGYQFIGIDPSDVMLDNAKSLYPNIQWQQGSAENTGLSDGQVDGIIATLTLHHWKSLEQGFRELYRALKPNGKIVILTSTPKQMEGYWVNHYFPLMMQTSIEVMPSEKEILNAMDTAGFKLVGQEKYFVHPELEDLFLQAGKHNPELYFDENVRKGISSFSALANKKEVEAGLQLLRNDINGGKIKEVMAAYESDEGDYLFMVGKK